MILGVLCVLCVVNLMVRWVEAKTETETYDANLQTRDCHRRRSVSSPFPCPFKTQARPQFLAGVLNEKSNEATMTSQPPF